MKKRLALVSLAVISLSLLPITGIVDVHMPKAVKKMPTNATWEQKKSNKRLAIAYAKAGWGWDKRQQKCIIQLFTKESRFDHLAKNQRGSSAYGIAQMLKEKSSKPEIQILHAYKYITKRYKTPCLAMAHHNRRNWY